MSWAAQMLQQQHPQSMASHFHLLPLIETFADAVERGIRDQHVEDLMNDLINRFNKCQEILISTSNNVNPKLMRSFEQVQVYG
eukprot:c6586_g1_i2 orf=226-474(+)